MVIKDKGWEILVVNDDSSDNTANALKEAEGGRLINPSYNKGYRASLKAGIKNAKTDLVVFYDADRQLRPEDLIGLYCSGSTEN